MTTLDKGSAQRVYTEKQNFLISNWFADPRRKGRLRWLSKIRGEGDEREKKLCIYKYYKEHQKRE